MRKFLVSTLVIFIISVMNVMAATWYVDPSGTDDGSHGTTSGTGAFKTIQYAIGFASVVNGDVINVAAGTYDVVSTIVINKGITITGPLTGTATARNTAVPTPIAKSTSVFEIAASNVTIEKLDITVETSTAYNATLFDESQSALIRVPNGAHLTGIIIRNNNIYVPLQPGAMTTWGHLAITLSDNASDGSDIYSNTVYNTRNGIVIRSHDYSNITNNTIYNTKGGIMNYTADQTDANNRIMNNNSWGSAHNEWDIVWNSFAYFVPDYQLSVLALSNANNEAYVVDRRAIDGALTLTGNRSHLFVNGTTGTLTVHPANGNINLPYATVSLGVSAVVPGGKVIVASGTYTEMLTINKSLKLTGLAGSMATTQIVAPATLPISDNPLSNIILVTGSGVNAEITGLTIKGPGPSNCGSMGRGIFVRDGANANIHDNQILDIRDAVFSGCQNGIAIQIGRNFWSTTGTATITNNLIQGYQKGGIIVDNTGSSATLTGNTITGAGTTTVTAQNGIQISRGATANLTGNTVSGNSFHIPGNQWDWGAAGILLYQSGAVTLGGGNNISGNDQNYYASEVTGTLTLGAEVFGASTAPVTKGYHIANSSNQNTDAQNCTFEGVSPSSASLTQMFAIEDRIWHVVDDPAYTGFVKVKNSNVYVTLTETGAKLQYGIDAASAGNTINVASGTYAENININKALILKGPNANIAGNGSRVSEAIIQFPAGAINGSNLITVGSNLTGVTISGFDLRCQDATIPQYHYLIVTEKVNNLTIRNNRMYGSEVPMYILTDNSMTDYRTGMLVEGNYVDCGPNVNSSYNRGIYVQATSGTIQDNQFLNTNIGIQYMPYGHTTSGLIQRNIVSAGLTGLYNNYQTLGAAQVTWSQNEVSVAPNDRLGLKAQVDGAWTQQLTFRGMEARTFGTQGSGAAPQVYFNNNKVDGNIGTSPYYTSRIGYRTYDANATGIATLTGNSLINLNMGAVNPSSVAVAATYNWWGTAIESEIVAKLSGNILYNPWIGSLETKPITNANLNTPVNFTTANTSLTFTSLPGGTNATVSVQRIESSTPPAGVPAFPPAAGSGLPLYLMITATGLTNYTFSVTVVVDVSNIAGFTAGSKVMYFSTASNSWVGIDGLYNPTAKTFTFTTDHFTPFGFVNPTNPNDIYISQLTTDPVNTQKWYPAVGMGDTVASPDWKYTNAKATFYVVPTGTTGMFSSKFTVVWDKTKANLNVNAGNYWGSQLYKGADSSVGNYGRYIIEIANTDYGEPNPAPGGGRYLAKLDFTNIKPGYIPVSIDGADFRYRVGDSVQPQSVYATTHPGKILFYLGDVAKAGDPTIGDGKIQFEDLTLFSAAYWSINGTHPSYKFKYDIGPTNANGSYWALPNSDGRIEFEDLNIFAIGYGKTGSGQLPDNPGDNKMKVSTLAMKYENGYFKVPVKVSGVVNDFRSGSFEFGYPSSELEFAGFEKKGGFEGDDNFMISKTESNKIMLDAAIVGAEKDGMSGEQVIMNLLFTEKQSGNHNVNVLTARARNSSNTTIEITLDGNGISSEIPTTFSLNQNYPNPFNPSTTIKYGLPNDTKVSLVVFDMLGRKVMTLVNDNQKAGYHEVQFNALNLSSGTYFYRIMAGDFTSIKRMILIK